MVRVHPMEALPYGRVVMNRNATGRHFLLEHNREAVTEVLEALRERGPLTNRDFAAPSSTRGFWHTSKTSAQALYYL